MERNKMAAAVGLLMTASKLAGLVVVVSIAANFFSFSRFRKRYLQPFRSPIDESKEVLADFNDLPPHDGVEGFFFGLATAPAHVEDKLNDAWLLFAEEKPCGDLESDYKIQPVKALMAYAASTNGAELERNFITRPLKLAIDATIRGLQKYSSASEDSAGGAQCSHNVASWHNVPHPEERLRFWSDPDTELKLAKDTGISIFRMGIDWGRIMPNEPNTSLQNTVNIAALERYRWIVERVRFYGMKVVITLFHHSLPPWAGEYGGWKVEKTVDYFVEFTRLVVDQISDLVDYWVTFNEPHIFASLTYTAGTWPGGHPGMIEAATSALPMGAFNQAMHWMSLAHIKAYDYIHKESAKLKPVVGVAHHVSFMCPYGLFDVAATTLATSLTVFPYIDSISGKLDFIGINYYGKEIVSGPGIKLVDNDEYSESGRCVYPDGLYRVLLQFHERYKHLKIPFFITENGVSDETDLIRKPYLLEHLLALYAAILKGVPVLGYLFWTTSDNWEWADGYGPKFGLVAVDRAKGLARSPRPSYYLFSKVVKSGKVTKWDRALAWDELKAAAKEKKRRPFFRHVDKNGLTYSGGLDTPTFRPYAQRDWRFGHYEMEGLQDPLSRLLRSISSLVWFEKTKKAESDVDDGALLSALAGS